MTSNEVRAFIKANYTSLTVGELAEAVGLSGPRMTVYCKELKITPVTFREKRVQFIKDHPDWRPEKIAEYFDCVPQSIRNIISKDNLRPQKEKVDITTWNQKKAKIKKAIQDVPIKENSANELASQLGFNKTERKPLIRPKAVYSQTHSPFYRELVKL